MKFRLRRMKSGLADEVGARRRSFLAVQSTWQGPIATRRNEEAYHAADDPPGHAR